MAGAPRPVKTVGEEFVAHRLLNRTLDFPDGSKLPRPLNMEEYVKDNPRRQTDLCAMEARRWFNNRTETGNAAKLKRVYGIRSNMFILNHDDPMNYFHVYFKGSIGNQQKYFFAELCGEQGPRNVISCLSVDKTQAFDNCKYCSRGLRHPPGGGFIGYKPNEPEP